MEARVTKPPGPREQALREMRQYFIQLTHKKETT